MSKDKDVVIELGGDVRSLNRPGWTSDDLHAYRHKYPAGCKFPKGRIDSYYAKSGGKQ